MGHRLVRFIPLRGDQATVLLVLLAPMVLLSLRVLCADPLLVLYSVLSSLVTVHRHTLASSPLVAARPPLLR